MSMENGSFHSYSIVFHGKAKEDATAYKSMFTHPDRKSSANKSESGIDQLQRVGYCGAFAVDVIASILLGVELNSQRNPNDPFVEHARHIFNNRPINSIVLLLFTMPFLMPLLKFFDIRVNLLPKESLQFLVENITHTIELRKKDSKPRQDFLQLLIDSAERHNDATHGEAPNYTTSSVFAGLSRDEIVAQAFMFLIAGYETTATTASLLAYNLSKYPNCQRKLQQEIDKQIGIHQSEVTSEDLVNMPYLQMCIEESLRLYPPALRIDRFCSKETKIDHQLTIPQGCIVTIPVYSVNNDPDYWSEPDQFIPERFSTSAKFERSSPSMYLPFGLGPRCCIGRRLALLELKVLFVHILRSFNIKPTQETPQQLQFEKGVLLQLKRPVLLRLELRENVKERLEIQDTKSL